MLHQILIGSVELTRPMITGAVYINNDMSTLRYVTGDLNTATPDDTASSFLFRMYDESEGCLLKGGFKFKD